MGESAPSAPVVLQMSSLGAVMRKEKRMEVEDREEHGIPAIIKPKEGLTRREKWKQPRAGKEWVWRRQHEMETPKNEEQGYVCMKIP